MAFRLGILISIIFIGLVMLYLRNKEEKRLKNHPLIKKLILTHAQDFIFITDEEIRKAWGE